MTQEIYFQEIIRSNLKRTQSTTRTFYWNNTLQWGWWGYTCTLYFRLFEAALKLEDRKENNIRTTRFAINLKQFPSRFPSTPPTCAWSDLCSTSQAYNVSSKTTNCTKACLVLVQLKAHVESGKRHRLPYRNPLNYLFHFLIYKVINIVWQSSATSHHCRAI